tara:strand:- start:95 stop:283 length:189 start_codon:yes stop_codon:yes gene_type:complete
LRKNWENIWKKNKGSAIIATNVYGKQTLFDCLAVLLKELREGLVEQTLIGQDVQSGARQRCT